MSNISNNSGLPEALVRAVQNDPYTKGDSEFSVTELIAPPRQVALKLQHKHEIEEDAEDRLFALYGQIAHTILERANVNSIAEKRYFGTIAGARVSAQVDTLDLEGGILSDWKFTTAWKFKPGSASPLDWMMQLNFQLELLRQNGLDAKVLQIIGLLRDHSKLEALRSADYPQKPVVVMPIPLWPREETLKLFAERVTLHRQARVTLPECSPEDRWAKPEMFAVMKDGGAKRALRVFDSRAAALDLVAAKPGYTVVPRPGENTRCRAYCSAAAFCSQWKALMPAAAEIEST